MAKRSGAGTGTSRWLAVERSASTAYQGAMSTEHADGGTVGVPVELVTDESFADAALRALEALDELGRPARSADRSRLVRELGLPRNVFAWLGRRRAIEPDPGGPADSRVLSGLGRQWLGDMNVPTGRSGVPAWKQSMRLALASFARDEGIPTSKERPYVLRSRKDWPRNLWPPLAKAEPLAALDVRPEDLHRWAHHLQSSQAFALNLFGPLKIAAGTGDPTWAWAREVFEPWFCDVTRVTFEYPLDGDPLDEVRPDSPHRTRVDVVVEHDGGTTATLIEVKLTESEFGPCSAAQDTSNPLRKTCTQPGWTLAASAACPLVVNRDRKYFALMKDSVVDVAAMESFGGDGCPLRNGRYQVVRNLLIASEMKRSGLDVRFAVAAPDATNNPRLHGPGSIGSAQDMESFLRGLVQPDAIETLFIAVERVVAGATTSSTAAAAWRDYMERKYLRALAAAAGTASAP